MSELEGLTEESLSQAVRELHPHLDDAPPAPPAPPAPVAVEAPVPVKKSIPSPPTSVASSSVPPVLKSNPDPNDYPFLHNLRRSWLRLEHYLDSELQQVPPFGTIQNKSGLHPSHIFLALLVLGFLFVTFGVAHRLICNTIGFAYPAMRSWKAISQPSQEGNSHWLVYWAIFASLHIIEYFENILIWCFPTWFVLKYVFLVWATVPFTGANEVIYSHVWRRIEAVRQFICLKQD